MKHLLLFAATTLLAACAATPPPPPLIVPAAQEAAAEPAAPAPAIPTRNAELAAFFETVDKAELAMSPISKAYRGIKDADYGKYDQFTDEQALAAREQGRRFAAELQQRFDRAAHSP